MFGGQYLPKMSEFVKAALGIDLNLEHPAQEDMEIAPPNLNHDFLAELGTESLSRRSFLKWERIMHSHGSCLAEVW